MTTESQISAIIGKQFRCTIPVRWGDLDALNHVNNTVFFRYFEEARVQLFERMGVVMPSDRGGVLVHASCDFLRPILYPADVTVTLIVEKVGRTSLTLDVYISTVAEPGVVFAQGKNVMVSTTREGKPLPWSITDLRKLADCFTIYQATEH